MLFLAGLVVLAVVAVPSREVQSLYGFERSWPKVAIFLPRLGSYFPGMAAIIALLWFLISRPARKRHPIAAVMLVAAAILFFLTIEIAGYTYLIPGFSALRAVSRLNLLLLLRWQHCLAC
jgi:hypothetical protein